MVHAAPVFSKLDPVRARFNTEKSLGDMGCTLLLLLLSILFLPPISKFPPFPTPSARPGAREKGRKENRRQRQSH